MSMGPQMPDISVNNHMANFNTGPYGDWGPPLKIKILRRVFWHVREDQKVGLEPNFHEPRSPNG